MKDYKKYLLRQLGIKESQFVPSPLREKDEYPGIDPDELEKGTEEEEGEHGMTLGKARKTAAQHLEEPGQAHYYSGLEKAKKAGMLKDQAMLSPTARPTPVIGIAIRGSSTGGLPSGADQTNPDISPSKVGGYNRVEVNPVNSKLVDKTPVNQAISQGMKPIVANPQTADPVTHPHQIQRTAGEEPQSTTGASTDSDPTLKLKTAEPKGIDIDIQEDDVSEEPRQEEENPMIPATSLSETFERHKKLMEASLGLKKCPCGCEKGKCTCGPQCKCRKTGVCECSTCGCGDPSDTHEHEPEKKPETKPEPKKPTVTKKQYFDPKTKTLKDVDWISMKEAKARVCFHCKKPHPCDCDKKDEEDAKLQRDNPEAYRKKFGMKVDKRSDLNESYSPPFARMRGLAGLGNVVLGSNGLWENVGASQPFLNHFKMDKEKAGYVKIDEEKLKKVRAMLNRKSKRGSLSDNELLLAKRLDEVLKRRSMQQQLKEGIHDQRPCDCGSGEMSNWEFDGNGIPLCRACPACRQKKLSRYRPEILRGYTQADVDEPIEPEDDSMGGLYEKKGADPADKRIGKMMKDPKDRPFPFDKDRTGPMRKGNEKGQLSAR